MIGNDDENLGSNDGHPMTTLDSLRILIIEDESYIRKIMFQILNRLQINKISEAEDGGEGFKKTLMVRPDLILCDIHMEPVDGIKFLRKLRSMNQPELANAPVVFLTSDANEEKVMMARKLKVSGYLVKPVSVNDVKKQISRAVGVTFNT